jgi:hypothetical protein
MSAVTRIGDLDVPHCSAMVRAVGSPNVFANGIAISRKDDVNTAHLFTGIPCPEHIAPITIGSKTVFPNVFAGG